MMSKPTKQAEILEIADVETLATLAKRLDTLASSQLGTQALSDIVVGSQLITGLPPVIERLVQDTQRQIGPKADALSVHDAYQGWKSNVGSLLQLCSGVDESPISFREFSEHVSQILDCLNKLMEQCRCAADDQVARANLQSDLYAISEIIAQSMLSGWLPMWNAVKSKIDGMLESGGTTQSAEDEIASFVDLWATSERIGSALVDIYSADGEWPVHRIQDETLSAWLLATLRDVSQWGDHQLARMLKLRPGELPAVPIDLNPRLTAPVVQMVFEVEVRLASLRAKAMGAVAAMERIATLREQSLLDGFVVRSELHEPISLLLSECVFDPEFLTGLRACSVILGVEIDEICRKTLLQTLQTTPAYLQTPRFAAQSDDSEGYHILSRVVSHEDVNVGYALRVWAKQSNWNACVYKGQSDSFWHRLRELGTPGWWIITALLNRIAAEEAILGDFLTAYLADDGRSPGALLPLAALRNVDITDESILSLLAAVELLAFRAGCELGARAIPIFIQRFAGQFPVLCARIRARLAAHVSLTKSSANSSLSGADLVQDLREQAYRSVRPRNYKGVKCIEQLSRRFVDEHAAPLLVALERATHADEIKNAMRSTDADLDVAHLIDQWGRDFLHGPEGRLRQRLIDDCKEMVDDVSAFGQKLLDIPDSTALKSLEEEIRKVRVLGSLAGHAADLMELILLEGEIPKVVFPGKPLIGNATLALFPRTLRLWNVGNLSLDSYLSEFDLDLREDVLDYAISEAATGRVGWAEQILENLAVPKTHSKRLAVEEKGQEWAELVELDRQELASEIGEDTETEDLAQVLEDLTAALNRQDYAEAVEVLEKLRPLASARHEAREIAKTERENVSRQVDAFLVNLSRAKLPLPVRSEWTKQILMLQDELASGADLTVVQNKLAELQDRITDGEDPPTLLEAVAESPSSTKAIEKAEIASGVKQPHDPIGYNGIVKALVGTTYGFIVPFDAKLREEEDIYFHINNVRSFDDGLPQLPPVGSIVGFSSVVQGPEQPRPSAQTVWILSSQDKDIALAALASQLGIALDRVGFVSGETLFTVGYGFHSGPFINREHRNSFAQFQVDVKGHTELRTLFPDSSSELSQRGSVFFHRLAKRATSPKKPPVLDVAAVSASMLHALHPSQPDSYKNAKALQGSIETREDHERAILAVDELANLRANRDQVAWWRAVLVGSYLTIAKIRQEPIQSVLHKLTETIPSWFGPNQEGTFLLVYQALHTFAESNPQELSYEQIWSFFNGIQNWLGPRPHFRLELIQAYVTIDDAEREIRGDLKLVLVRRAEKHVKRSMVIHPRMTEPHDLLRQIEARFGKRRLSEEWAGSDLNDPVLATRDIRIFYDSLGGRADEERATRFYREQRQEHTLKGLALDELIGRHCRYLLTSDSATEAETFLLDEARQGHVENWSMVVDLLHDVWIEQNLDVERVRQEVKRLRDTLPTEAQPHLELLLGRILFEKGRYDSALRHADQAQVSLRSTEARQLLTRCRQMVQRGIEKISASLEQDKAKDDAWNEAQRIAAEGDSAALTEFVLSHMDDSVVGPWLTLMCVSKNGLLAHDAERRSLVLRSRSLEMAPSIELLKADIRVRWNDLIAQRIECLDPALLNKAVKEPSGLLAESSVLDEMDHDLSDVGASFALYDALLQIHPSNLAIRWRLAALAKKRWSTDKEQQFIEIYVQASLPCVGFSDTGIVSPAVVANDMLSMKLFGLCAIVAYFGLQNGNQALAVILKIAEEKATPTAWEWPSVLQRSRVELDEGSWGIAANSVFCALRANPCHWPSCRAYLKAFSDPPRGEDPAMLKAALRMALFGIQLIGRTEQGKQSPELLVLQAELVLAVAALEDNQVASDKAAMECSDLCSQAQRLRQGFKLAITLQNRLKPDVFLAPGETYAKRYRIVEALPPGSYGQVYRAEVIGPKPGESTTVALKLVRADAPTPEKRQQQRSALEREARIALRLKHPCIVRVHDFIDGRCLVMEYIDGKTLASWIDGGVFMPWEKAFQIGIQVAVALEHASDVARREFGTEDTRAAVREFAHRDIHPGNIMVTNSHDGYQTKLLDFGLARVPGGTATTAVFAGVNRRLVYRAPEYGTRMLDHRGDMFALGVILYQLITGEDPYPSDLYCDFQITQEPADVAGTLRSLDQLAPPDTTIPHAFSAVAARMVAFRSADRPDDWTSVIRDLRDVSLEMTGGSG